MKIYLTVDCGPFKNNCEFVRVLQLRIPNLTIGFENFKRVVFVSDSGGESLYMPKVYANSNRKRFLKWWGLET